MKQRCCVRGRASRTGKLYHLCLCSGQDGDGAWWGGESKQGVCLEGSYVILPSNRKQRQRALEAWRNCNYLHFDTIDRVWSTEYGVIE